MLFKGGIRKTSMSQNKFYEDVRGRRTYYYVIVEWNPGPWAHVVLSPFFSMETGNSKASIQTFWTIVTFDVDEGGFVPEQ